MYPDDFEKAFSDFLERREYDQAANALFSMVRIPAGETLVRAFQVQEGESADLRNKLTVEITGIGDGEAQVRLSSEQYGGSTRK